MTNSACGPMQQRACASPFLFNRPAYSRIQTAAVHNLRETLIVGQRAMRSCFCPASTLYTSIGRDLLSGCSTFRHLKNHGTFSFTQSFPDPTRPSQSSGFLFKARRTTSIPETGCSGELWRGLRNGGSLLSDGLSSFQAQSHCFRKVEAHGFQCCKAVACL